MFKENKIARMVFLFSMLCILFSFIVTLFRSELWGHVRQVWNGMKELTIEEIFDRYPQSMFIAALLIFAIMLTRTRQ